MAWPRRLAAIGVTLLSGALAVRGPSVDTVAALGASGLMLLLSCFVLLGTVLAPSVARTPVVAKQPVDDQILLQKQLLAVTQRLAELEAEKLHQQQLNTPVKQERAGTSKQNTPSNNLTHRKKSSPKTNLSPPRADDESEHERQANAAAKQAIKQEVKKEQ